jgi:hypothetical protein
MQPHEAPVHWQSPPPPPPPVMWSAPQQRAAGAGTTALVVLVLVLTLVNLGLTYYVFRVAYELAQFGDSVTGVFGG